MENVNNSYRSQHALKVALKKVYQEAATLVQLFNAGKSRNEELSQLNQSLTLLDDKNPDYKDIIGDQRESNKRNGMVFLLLATIAIDIVLSFQALSILCAQLGLPPIVKFIVPPALLMVEIIICYTQILNHRNGGRTSFVLNVAQFAVIVFLVALCVMGILNSAESYNQDIDKLGFLAYMFINSILQITLLVFSVLLHLWMIYNAEEIAESVAFFNYKLQRNKLTNAIKRIEQANNKRFIPQFMDQVHHWVRCNELFKLDYPDVKIDFSKTIPEELKAVINTILGTDYFPSSTNAA